MPEQHDVIHIWLLTEHRDGSFTADTFGLTREAQQLKDHSESPVFVTAVVMGDEILPQTLRVSGITVFTGCFAWRTKPCGFITENGFHRPYSSPWKMHRRMDFWWFTR